MSLESGSCSANFWVSLHKQVPMLSCNFHPSINRIIRWWGDCEMRIMSEGISTLLISFLCFIYCMDSEAYAIEVLCKWTLLYCWCELKGIRDPLKLTFNLRFHLKWDITHAWLDMGQKSVNRLLMGMLDTSVVKYISHVVPQHKTCSASFQSKRMTCPWAKMQQWNGGIHQNYTFKTTICIAPNLSEQLQVRRRRRQKPYKRSRVNLRC